MFFVYINRNNQADVEFEDTIKQRFPYRMICHAADFKYLIYCVPVGEEHDLHETFMQMFTELPAFHYGILYSALNYPPALAQANRIARERLSTDHSAEDFFHQFVRDVKDFLEEHEEDEFIYRQLVQEPDDADLSVGTYYWIQLRKNPQDLFWVSESYQLNASKTQFFRL